MYLHSTFSLPTRVLLPPEGKLNCPLLLKDVIRFSRLRSNSTLTDLYFKALFGKYLCICFPQWPVGQNLHYSLNLPLELGREGAQYVCRIKLLQNWYHEMNLIVSI